MKLQFLSSIEFLLNLQSVKGIERLWLEKKLTMFYKTHKYLTMSENKKSP